MSCYRYVELNPVRAGMITPRQDYLNLGSDPLARQTAYRELIREHLDNHSSPPCVNTPSNNALEAATASASRSKY